MLIDDHFLMKFGRLCDLYEAHRFDVVLKPQVELAETMEHRREPPADLAFRDCPPGTPWGRQWGSAWFRTAFRIPKECRARRVLVRLASLQGAGTFGGKEYLVFLGITPHSILCDKHREAMILKKARGGEPIVLHIEGYAGHHVPGCGSVDGGLRPAGSERRRDSDFRIPFPGIEIVCDNAAIADLIDDMRVLLGTAAQLQGKVEVVIGAKDVLPPMSLRKANILNGVKKAFLCLESDPDWTDDHELTRRIREANRHLKPLLARRNGPTTPLCGIVGHAHLDTAWLWPLSECIRKAARTFSTQVTLAEEFPEFRFHQSQPLHMEWVREFYPTLYKRVKAVYRKGQWEPGGSVWVEPDCNMIGGEAMIRQFLVGKRSTRDLWDGHESDFVWLPDVFGYSGAMPQIMLGCETRYLVTSKMSWNDTNRFPYDTFMWRGIDGSEVFTHFIVGSYNSQMTPAGIHHLWNQVLHKDVQDRFLVATGHGDGGGGLTEGHCRMARRMRNLEGNPRVQWVKVGEFLRKMRSDGDEWPMWVGELYLEAHRGVFTSQARLKKANRTCERLLHDVELLASRAWLNGHRYPFERLQALWKEVLTFQFHDILPGSSIRRVNEETEKRYAELTEELERMRLDLLPSALPMKKTKPKGRSFALVNTLGWTRSDTVHLPADRDASVFDSSGGALISQPVERFGQKVLAVAQVELPAFGARSLTVVARGSSYRKTVASPFVHDGQTLDTPHYRVRFDASGRIVGLRDKVAARELVPRGGALNTLLLAEDIPWNLDNWEMDADIAHMLKPVDCHVNRVVASSGPVEHRIRTTYDFGVFHASKQRSVLTQDTVFHARDRRIDFETTIEWHHSHRLLKASFPLDLLVESARCEIQFGHLVRPTHRNTSFDRAMFEFCAHKWVSIDEGGYGVALLNDCKYGHDVKGATVNLTLLRSGCHPDEKADQGPHSFTYSLLPHAGGFSVSSVVRPAYELNVPPIVSEGPEAFGNGAGESLFFVDNTSTIVETVKKADDEDALIVRLYDAEKTRRKVTVTASLPVKRVVECNMLERDIRPCKVSGRSWGFELKPFEIKTFKLYM